MLGGGAGPWAGAGCPGPEEGAEGRAAMTPRPPPGASQAARITDVKDRVLCSLCATPADRGAAGAGGGSVRPLPREGGRRRPKPRLRPRRPSAPAGPAPGGCRWRGRGAAWRRPQMGDRPAPHGGAAGQMTLGKPANKEGR
jgi:hypothetical protein